MTTQQQVIRGQQFLSVRITSGWEFSMYSTSVMRVDKRSSVTLCCNNKALKIFLGERLIFPKLLPYESPRDDEIAIKHHVDKLFS